MLCDGWAAEAFVCDVPEITEQVLMCGLLRLLQQQDRARTLQALLRLAGSLPASFCSSGRWYTDPDPSCRLHACCSNRSSLATCSEVQACGRPAALCCKGSCLVQPGGSLGTCTDDKASAFLPPQWACAPAAARGSPPRTPTGQSSMYPALPIPAHQLHACCSRGESL